MIKVASFNINGIKARLPRLLEWLEETRPSVACLQEIKTQDEGFPAAEFEKLGYKAIWHGQKGFNGVAILADGGADPVHVAADLISQAEHDTLAASVLVTDSDALADAVDAELRERIEDVILNRRADATERLLEIAGSFKG